MTQTSICLSFDDNNLLLPLFGEHENHLHIIEKQTGVEIASRGSQVMLRGDKKSVAVAQEVLQRLYKEIKRGENINALQVDALARTLNMPLTGAEKEDLEKRRAGYEGEKQDDEGGKNNEAHSSSDASKWGHAHLVEKKGKTNVTKDKRKTGTNKVGAKTEKENMTFSDRATLTTPRKVIKAYTRKQEDYINMLVSRDVVFGAGPAGTGKTYLAVCAAVQAFAAGEVDRIILSRPAVEAGENLGFLPGDLKDKVDPYLRPLYDALYETLSAERVEKHIENGDIEIAPLAYMRGRTLKNAYVILDEAQNTTEVQMKMFLTRLGEGARMAITGDLSQTDLPGGVKSGFRDAIEKLKEIDEIAIVELTSNDVVRHPLTVKIVEAYERLTDNRWDSKNPRRSEE